MAERLSYKEFREEFLLAIAIATKADTSKMINPIEIGERIKGTFPSSWLEAGWPAAGFVDTEIRCLTELESGNAKKEVQPRVQA